MVIRIWYTKFYCTLSAKRCLVIDALALSGLVLVCTRCRVQYTMGARNRGDDFLNIYIPIYLIYCCTPPFLQSVAGYFPSF